MWCKDYSNGDPKMLWISKSYEDVFGIKREDYQGAKDSDIWPEEIAYNFKQNDLLAIEKGIYSTYEPLGIDDPAWSEVFVIKWAVQTRHFGHDMTLVYGLAAPGDRRQAERLWHHVRNRGDTSGA